MVQIHELISEKYKVPASFDEVYRAALHFGNKPGLERQAGLRDFLQLLEENKKTDD